MEKRHQETRQAGLERAKAEIAERLANVCRSMEPREFDQLVTRIAHIRIKYTMRRSDEWKREFE